ncbi:hypothetical protein [Metamycoplasma hyosynoviae]|uniref:Uncharacterized protein n=1 Tax=Metamycoplasma hyosynoviae TaxID=29559 RepID=A0A4R7TV39_9BACT|nr:hypothetical protein [Metamycoplasma hyosynoviae]TDU96661.1 hypothetical protein JN03_0534 [Metamycoplasma hyosynoviae]
MSANKKWKNKKINFDNYKSSDEKNEKVKFQLSDNWKIALIALFLIAIPSFLMFLLLGGDGWLIPATKSYILNNKRWSMLLPIALAVAIIQISVLLLLVLKFKVLKTSSLQFLIPIALAMNTFLVSSGVELGKWYIRVLPAVGFGFMFFPIMMINKEILKKKINKSKAIEEKKEAFNKSLLD